jgi:hypothetical protein
MKLFFVVCIAGVIPAVELKGVEAAEQLVDAARTPFFVRHVNHSRFF